MILTSGNGLGKSTVMKSVPYAMITASIGIAPVDQFMMTPFTRVMCHMNVSDDIAAGTSGFTAELQLKDKVVKELAQLPRDQFTFIVLDELFRSTNATDAATLTTVFASHIASHANTLSILATHYEPVIKLEDNGTHSNYHMGSIAQPNGLPPKPTFTIEPGASLEHNAVAFTMLVRILRKQQSNSCYIKKPSYIKYRAFYCLPSYHAGTYGTQYAG